MLQLDMTGYWDKTLGRKMGIVGDFTDPDLTAMLRLVVDEYTSNTTSRLETTCAYACSGTTYLSACLFWFAANAFYFARSLVLEESRV